MCAGPARWWKVQYALGTTAWWCPRLPRSPRSRRSGKLFSTNSLQKTATLTLCRKKKKLVWVELPQCQQRRATHASASYFASSAELIGISRALENLVVNPITGPGRSAADVQREKRAHQSHVREAAADTDYPAVFQADYLFVQIYGRELQLHRVAHGLVIEEAMAPNISFSTAEYTHTPQPGMNGFWGHFSQTPNPALTTRMIHARDLCTFATEHMIAAAFFSMMCRP
eukprot:5026546-Pleurochrysis_carterae.AAC.1